MRSFGKAGICVMVTTMVTTMVSILCIYPAQAEQPVSATAQKHPSNLAPNTTTPKTSRIQIPTAEPCELKSGPVKTVTKIIDSLTVKLNDNSELRLADIIIPFPHVMTGADPDKPSPVPNNAAMAFLKTRVLGKAARLKYSEAKRDRYGRRLAHPHIITDGNEIWLQAELVKRGFALVAPGRTTPNCIKHLLKLETQARKKANGYWGTHIFNVRQAHKSKELLNDLQTFQIVGGRVKRISGKNGTIYLNFPGNWKKDFTVSISRRIQKAMKWDLTNFTSLKGRYIRIRGWIEENYGPLIRMRQPSDLEHFLDRHPNTKRNATPTSSDKVPE